MLDAGIIASPPLGKRADRRSKPSLSDIKGGKNSLATSAKVLPRRLSFLGGTASV